MIDDVILGFVCLHVELSLGFVTAIYQWYARENSISLYDGSMKTAANEFIPAQGQGNENIEDDIADIITVSNRMMEAGKNVATHL